MQNSIKSRLKFKATTDLMKIVNHLCVSSATETFLTALLIIQKQQQQQKKIRNPTTISRGERGIENITNNSLKTVNTSTTISITIRHKSNYNPKVQTNQGNLLVQMTARFAIHPQTNPVQSGLFGSLQEEGGGVRVRGTAEIVGITG